MKTLLRLSLMGITSAALAASALACTAFQLESKDGANIYFRSMEFGFPLNSKALIVPHDTEYTGTTPDGKPGLKWKTQYGFVGLNIDVAKTAVADGQNEKGLAIGLLYLPSFAQYMPPDASQADRTIGSWEVGAYLLSTCATVDEAIDALKNKVRVVEEECPPFKMVLPLHYWIGDSTGRVVIAEYVAGELHIHEAPLGVLTNSPPYEWQTLNVANYVNLSPINSPPVDLGRVQLDNVNQGTGFVGLPGDFTPPSRFVRAALFSHWATQADTAKDTVNLGFHILNTFDIFNGAIQAKASGSASATTNTDITEWVVAHDRTNHKTYIRTYGGLAFQMIDLNKIDFAKPGFRTIELQTDFAPADITESTQPLAQQ